MSLALDVLLLDTSPVCDVCMHLIAVNVRLQSPCAQERVQLRMQLCDMHALANDRRKSNLQQRQLVCSVACRDSSYSELELALLSSSDVQAKNIEAPGHAMLVAIANIKCRTEP